MINKNKIKEILNSLKEKKDLILYRHPKIFILLFCFILIILISYSFTVLQKNEPIKKEIKIEVEIIKTQKNIILPITYKEEIKVFVPKKEIIIPEPLTNSIALIIDDCGVDQDNTSYIVKNFPNTITLSYLPYSNNIQSQVNLAIDNGNEIMLHLPMEAISYNEPNINTLRTYWDDEILIDQTNEFLNSFTGYTSVNNHTGSKFTQDKYKMSVVLQELKDRNLSFLDSITTNKSVAYKVAQEMQIPSAKRHIFIDHEDDFEYIYKQLLKAEFHAKKNGLAIVIGHPRDNTIIAIEKWLLTLNDKNINLVPMSEVF